MFITMLDCVLAFSLERYNASLCVRLFKILLCISLQNNARNANLCNVRLCVTLFTIMLDIVLACLL